MKREIRPRCGHLLQLHDQVLIPLAFSGDPIIQVKAEARWMSDLIERSTGKRFPVQPVVVYPGWYVETTRPNPDVWVLNETVVPTFIKNARGSLTPEDVSLITFHLKRYVITCAS